MRSLDTRLRVDGRLVDTRHEFLTYRIERVQGDWLWLVSDRGTRGWAHRSEVVPADRAAAYFSEVIAREPRSAEAYRMRGLAHARAKQYRRAIRDAGEAIRLDPKSSAAHVDRCYARLGELEFLLARADADAAIRLDPGSTRAYRARAHLSRVKADMDDVNDLPFGRALAPEWRRRRHAKPLADLETAIRIDPDDPMLRLDRAWCWHELEDDDRAIVDATAALRLDPTMTFAYGARAAFRASQKDRRGAMEDADAMVRLDPRSPSVYIRRAEIRMKFDDYDGALADCDEAVRLDPKDPAIHLVKGITLALKGDVWHGLGEWVFHPMILGRSRLNVGWD
jgi:tetratricopeptide (TPR) repeat protein